MTDAIHESFITVVIAFALSRAILLAQYIISKSAPGQNDGVLLCETNGAS
jgi:hypothetical protein